MHGGVLTDSDLAHDPAGISADELVGDDAGADAPTYRAGYVLLVLVTAVMFLRPSELLPAIKDVPIYEPLILACLFASLPVLLGQFRWELLAAQPGSLCVVGLWPIVVLSNLLRGDLWRARMGGFDFFKLLLYYLLLIGLVNTASRFRNFLHVLATFIFSIAALSLLNHHRFIDIEALDAMQQLERYDEITGTRATTVRLQASGIFNDPNDFSLILVGGTLICLHMAMETGGWVARLPFLVPLPVYLYALALTRSRGGFLSLLAGLGVLFVCRLGWRKALPLGLVGLPIMLVAFGGRQTRIDLGDESDTGHARVSIWSDGLQLLKESPVFGCGYGMMGRRLRIVAHNSFVHSYTELGLVGGTLFLGAFYLPTQYLRRLRDHAEPREGGARTGTDDVPQHAGRADGASDPAADEWPDDEAGDTPPPQQEQPAAFAELIRWRPCVLALFTSYAIGLCSLSRAYTVTTYLILGLVGAYCTLVAAARPSAGPRPPAEVFPRLIVISCCFLVALYVFVRVVT